MTTGGRLRGRVRGAVALAHRDPVTGLPMRPTLMRALRRELASAGPGTCVGLLYLDLDGFKRVNDTAGHDLGDHVLRVTARRLARSVGPVDLVVRLSGDEFVVLTVADDPTEVRGLAERLSRELAQPLPLRPWHAAPPLVSPASVGVATHVGGTSPVDGGRPDYLLRCADLAMLAAKRRGIGRVETFEPSMLDRAYAAFRADAALGEAVEEQAFGLRYQPVLDLVGDVVRVEALLRFVAPDGTPGRPGELLAVAESTGRLDRITAWVLAHALAAAGDWWRAGREAPLAVNVSAAQLAHPEAVGHLAAAAEQAAGLGGALVLEVHRPPGPIDLAGVRAGCADLAVAGVGVVCEDIDTAWPLAEVTALSPQVVSLSGSTVAALPCEPAAAAMAGALVQAATSLGAGVTAKNVETQAQRRSAAELGCTQVQGDLLGRVTSADQIDWQHRDLIMRDTDTQDLTPDGAVATVSPWSTAFSYAERASADTQRTRDPSSPLGPGGFSRPDRHTAAAEEN